MVSPHFTLFYFRESYPAESAMERGKANVDSIITYFGDKLTEKE
jgi:hypothetical protein